MLRLIKLALTLAVVAIVSHYVSRGDTGAAVRELTTQATDIDELVAHPGLYDGKTVKVVGKVVNRLRKLTPNRRPKFL